ncbi:hypothetical protein ACFLU6_12995 [Acidobacteriota bacterium]
MAMKQLTILCSEELIDRIIFALKEEGIEGYIHIPEAYANRFTQDDPISPFVTWGATVLIVPAPGDVVRRVTERLKKYAGECKDEPCLKIMVSSLEEFF